MIITASCYQPHSSVQGKRQKMLRAMQCPTFQQYSRIVCGKDTQGISCKML
jgi:hypothetical protein